MLNGGINIYGKARKNMSREIKYRAKQKDTGEMDEDTEREDAHDR